jgi:hypothetical protein
MITLGPSLTGLRGTQVTGSIIYTLVSNTLYSTSDNFTFLLLRFDTQYFHIERCYIDPWHLGYFKLFSGAIAGERSTKAFILVCTDFDFSNCLPCTNLSLGIPTHPRDEEKEEYKGVMESPKLGDMWELHLHHQHMIVVPKL